MVLQWGHRLSAMESSVFGARRQVARLALQWGHRLSAMERMAEGPYSYSLTAASMGPPPFGDGKYQGPRDCGGRKRGFNGATAFRRWKGEFGLGAGIRLAELQWGHRLSAMERRYAQRGGECVRNCFNGATAFRRWKAVEWYDRISASLASMGPPPFGDGKWDRSWGAIADVGTLQWGHRLSAMESPGCTTPAMPRTRFNGATAFRRWKVAMSGDGAVAVASFNGATAFRRWKGWLPS